jgi:hypothetical protein
MNSYGVKFWAIRPGKAKTKRTYEIRWKVGHVPHSRTLGNKAQAENFLSDLRHAARTGESFDTVSGLPGSLSVAKLARSWFEFCLAYVDMNWPSAAPKTRDGITDALAAVIPAVVGEQLPDGLEVGYVALCVAAFRAASQLAEPSSPTGGGLCFALAGEGLASGQRDR